MRIRSEWRLRRRAAEAARAIEVPAHASCAGNVAADGRLTRIELDKIALSKLFTITHPRNLHY